MNRVKGSFEIKINPTAPNEESEGITFTKMSFEKTWQGGLVATSTGEMLTAGTVVGGKMSAGYVAIERVRGTLAGQSGTFVFQHSATLNRGAQDLAIQVVPDSGSGGLSGIEGTLLIEITGDTHHYTFDYSLPQSQSPRYFKSGSSSSG